MYICMFIHLFILQLVYDTFFIWISEEISLSRLRFQILLKKDKILKNIFLNKIFYFILNIKYVMYEQHENIPLFSL